MFAGFAEEGKEVELIAVSVVAVGADSFEIFVADHGKGFRRRRSG